MVNTGNSFVNGELSLFGCPINHHVRKVKNVHAANSICAGKRWRPRSRSWIHSVTICRGISEFVFNRYLRMLEPCATAKERNDAIKSMLYGSNQLRRLRRANYCDCYIYWMCVSRHPRGFICGSRGDDADANEQKPARRSLAGH
jgi:hypothetical protein